MGGPALDGLKTLTASGRTKRVRGNNLVPIEFELGIELPDKYFRKDEFPAEETDPTSLGFNGDSLVQTPAPVAGPPPGARPGGPPPPTPAQIEAQRKTRVNGVKQDFVRFALGMFATSFETYPLTFAFAAQAEAPQGKADVLDVTGAGGFKLRFLIHSETHLPIMVSWQLPPTNVIMRVPSQRRRLSLRAPWSSRRPRPRGGRRHGKRKMRTQSRCRRCRRKRAPHRSSIASITPTIAT